MIDTTEQNKWLKEWVKDDPDNLGTDLETRTFNALEVEMIMQIYSSEVVKNNVALHDVSNTVMCGNCDEAIINEPYCESCYDLANSRDNT